MKIISIALLLYLLFLIELVGSQYSRVWPDLTLVTILVVALHETRFTTAVLGVITGFFFDLVTPTCLGTNMLGLGLVGYVAAAARGYFYPAPWFFPVLVLGGLLLHRIVALIGGIPSSPLVLQIASALLTVVFSLPVRHIITWVFYRPPRPD